MIKHLNSADHHQEITRKVVLITWFDKRFDIKIRDICTTEKNVSPFLFFSRKQGKISNVLSK